MTHQCESFSEADALGIKVTVICRSCGADNTKIARKRCISGFGLRHIACQECGFQALAIEEMGDSE